MKVFARILGVLALLWSVNTHATPILGLDLEGAGTAVTDPRPFTIGWAFEVLNPVKIAGLGFWDEGANGLATSHLVRLWTDAEVLLASATVDNADAVIPSSESGLGQWIFDQSVALILNPGRYVIGADGGFASDAARFNQGFVSRPDIAFIESREDLNHGFPTESGVANAYFGPNLLIESTVPAPGTFALLVLGLVGLRFSRHKKFKPIPASSDSSRAGIFLLAI